MLTQRYRAAPGEHWMQDSKPTPQCTLRVILWSLAATFALFCGGYYLGKDLAQRDNARQSAGR